MKLKTLGVEDVLTPNGRPRPKHFRSTELTQAGDKAQSWGLVIWLGTSDEEEARKRAALVKLEANAGYQRRVGWHDPQMDQLLRENAPERAEMRWGRNKKLVRKRTRS